MKHTPLDLYRYAESRGIDVNWFPLKATPSLSVQLPDGSCAIAMDPWWMGTLARETVSLAHELGHCETGSFYNPNTGFDLRQRHENRANKWAIRKLIQPADLEQAVANGYHEIWQLAEYFGVTEDFMRSAICLYTHGNLADTSY